MTSKTYECHKGPPQVVPDHASIFNDYRGVWPPITPGRWCGEHKSTGPRASHKADVKCCNNCRYARLVVSGHP